MTLLRCSKKFLFSDLSLWVLFWGWPHSFENSVVHSLLLLFLFVQIWRSFGWWVMDMNHLWLSFSFWLEKRSSSGSSFVLNGNQWASVVIYSRVQPILVFWLQHMVSLCSRFNLSFLGKMCRFWILVARHSRRTSHIIATLKITKFRNFRRVSRSRIDQRKFTIRIISFFLLRRSNHSDTCIRNYSICPRNIVIQTCSVWIVHWIESRFTIGDRSLHSPNAVFCTLEMFCFPLLWFIIIHLFFFIYRAFCVKFISLFTRRWLLWGFEIGVIFRQSGIIIMQA